MEAINSLALPVVAYSFNIIDWKLKDIRHQAEKQRKLLTSERIHPPKSDVGGAPEGGIGPIQLEMPIKQQQ